MGRFGIVKAGQLHSTRTSTDSVGVSQPMPSVCMSPAEIQLNGKGEVDI